MAHSQSPQDWCSYHFRLLDLNLYAVSFLRALDLFPFQIFFNLLNQPILKIPIRGVLGFWGFGVLGFEWFKGFEGF